MTTGRSRKRVAAGAAASIPAGERLLLTLDGKQIGVFNINGRFYALHNRCPHMGGALCAGPLTGTTLPADDFRFTYGREGEIIRCAWHGWEFDITDGRSLVNPALRARSYPVTVEDGQLFVHI